MQWVDLLQDLTGWQGARWERDWADTEAELGVSLPDDFKELSARFGPGSFADYIRTLPSTGPESLLGWHRRDAEFQGDPEDYEWIMGEIYGPYDVFGATGKSGVLRWGLSDAPEGNFYWLADAAVDPAKWPVLAKGDVDGPEEWERFDVTASEFVYRVLTEGDSMVFALRESALERPRTFVPFEGYREQF